MYDNCKIPFCSHYVVHIQPNIDYRSYSLLIHYCQHEDNVVEKNVSAYGYMSFSKYVNYLLHSNKTWVLFVKVERQLPRPRRIVNIGG